MRYISTRGLAPAVDFETALLQGLAPDGGLYVPQTWPYFTAETWQQLQGKSYTEVAFAVIKPFVGGAIDDATLRQLILKAYAGFAHKAVAPLVQLDSQLWLMELFHGPTIAFKDVALQLLGLLFEHVLNRKKQRLTIVGATSGDTGSAAIEGCRGREAMDIFILHPAGRVSDVQRKQMTTVADKNVHNIAIQGTFDDCQALVKRLFADTAMQQRCALGAINSINWARIMAQIVYYATAALALGAPHRAINFAVPTGNFGNIFAAYSAKKMGLPIHQLLCASNANDSLTRFYSHGVMQGAAVVPTLSPSMDIQISSNFERLLFDLVQQDAAAVRTAQTAYTQTGHYHITPEQHHTFQNQFIGYRADDAETIATMRRVYAETGQMIDPHTAVGLAAVYAQAGERTDAPTVSLACAHPAKFAPAVRQALGIAPLIPARVAACLDKPERLTLLDNDYKALCDFIGRTAP